MTLITTIRTGGPAKGRAAEGKLVNNLAFAKGVLVAFSGGIDSAYLAAMALRGLSDKALAVTAVSPSLAPEELELAKNLAKEIGIKHILIHTKEMDDPRYRENKGDRCYFCKQALFSEMNELLAQYPGYRVAYGAIPDDLGDDRPGMVAAKEQGAWAPLLEVGMNKAMVREMARSAGLTVWDKPASACLASRIPVGTAVSPGNLSQVAQAEALLHRMGLGQVRVRHEGATARIEVPENDFEFFSNSTTRHTLRQGLMDLGFEKVVLDLKPYGRQGSMSGE